MKVDKLRKTIEKFLDQDELIPLGDITELLEPLRFYMCERHKLQRHEMEGLLDKWIKYHYPGAIEEYEDE